ncbi:MAG: ABC transporter substrate-binding protein [Gaiellaceae bacterium]
MTLLVTENPGSVDPAINYGSAWLQLNITNDGLLAFRKVGGAAGNELVPDLATSIPKPSGGGTTYTFKVRRGIKYSTGATLKPSDFRHAFERMFEVRGPTTGAFYAGIVGAPPCLVKPTCNLSKGVVADDAAGTVRFRLVCPDPEFLLKLALPFASAVPPSAPARDVGPKALPGTGPYKWESYAPNRLIRLVRNPFFKEWSHEAQPDGYPDVILIRLGLPIEGEITQVENGQADGVLAPSLPTDRLNEISSKYPAQTHVDAQTAINFVALNTRVPPFDNVLVRRAVNYAADRNAFVKIYGGSKLAVTTCQVLPPGFPGYKPYCPYSKGGGGTRWVAPDVAKAKALIAKSRTKGQKVVAVLPAFPAARSVGLYLVDLLNSLGYRASLKLLSPPIAGPLVANSRNKVQLTIGNWSQDYPAASDFLNTLVSCRGFHPNTDANLNVSEFCDRKIQRLTDRALALGVQNPAAANRLWAQVDRAVTDQAPLLVMNNPRAVNFVSKRVRNYQYNKLWYWLVDQSWVR